MTKKNFKSQKIKQNFFLIFFEKSLPVVKGVVLTLERFWGSELEQLLWMDQKEIYPHSNLIIL